MTDIAAREPVQFANYRGRLTNILTDGPKGPNTLGELLYPVTADYDPETNKTRVGFSYIAPPTNPNGEA